MNDGGRFVTAIHAGLLGGFLFAVIVHLFQPGPQLCRGENCLRDWIEAFGSAGAAIAAVVAAFIALYQAKLSQQQAKRSAYDASEERKLLSQQLYLQNLPRVETLIRTIGTVYLPLERTAFSLDFHVRPLSAKKPLDPRIVLNAFGDDIKTLFDLVEGKDIIDLQSLATTPDITQARGDVRQKLAWFRRAAIAVEGEADFGSPNRWVNGWYAKVDGGQFDRIILVRLVEDVNELLSALTALYSRYDIRPEDHRIVGAQWEPDFPPRVPHPTLDIPPR